jgi:hypothetical protein
MDDHYRLRMRDCLHWLQRTEDELLYAADAPPASGTLGAGQGSDFPAPVPRQTYYILVEQQPVPVADVLTWGAWFETADRYVRNTWILARQGTPTLRVSTVFLGLDHAWVPGAPPLLFETMVFGADYWEDFEARYPTWAEAEHGHRQVCAHVRQWLDTGLLPETDAP